LPSAIVQSFGAAGRSERGAHAASKRRALASSISRACSSAVVRVAACRMPAEAWRSIAAA
jgi:hypothetical protein